MTEIISESISVAYITTDEGQQMLNHPGGEEARLEANDRSEYAQK
jgi:hypothetical protein